ncbi:unnamed protein product [Soboliphyme baturini]|uniref:Uncharacterized protein n=1 Tax=Soboliphyme baturini TaxID=241478 RepID=A0A183IHX3_9BILA|nr:unnamed protein product [Soboliphyme baturini]
MTNAVASEGKEERNSSVQERESTLRDDEECCATTATTTVSAAAGGSTQLINLKVISGLGIGARNWVDARYPGGWLTVESTGSKAVAVLVVVATGDEISTQAKSEQRNLYAASVAKMGSTSWCPKRVCAVKAGPFLGRLSLRERAFFSCRPVRFFPEWPRRKRSRF